MKITNYVVNTFKVPLKRAKRWVHMALNSGVTAKRIVRRRASYRLTFV